MNELEYVFKKVLDIDNRASELQQKKKLEVESKISLLSNELREIDERLIQSTKLELEATKERKVAEAEKIAKEYLKDTEELCTTMTKSYATIKEDLKHQLVKDILEAY